MATAMRFLDLDLDFFLNRTAYRSGSDTGRLGSEYKPWSISEVRHFLEDRCGLSQSAPIQGRMVESHVAVLDFWRTLITSSRLTAPFEVIHVDAHPDLWVGNGLHITVGFLYIDSKHGLASINRKYVHSGNYLTFAILYGWVGSLVWVPLLKRMKDLPKWNGDARTISIQSRKSRAETSAVRGLPMVKGEQCIPFTVVPWQQFRTDRAFDYMVLSRSPDFTPPESDTLVTVIERYMKQI